MNPLKFAMLNVNFFLRNSKKSKPEDILTIYCQLEIDGLLRDVPWSTRLKCPKKYWKNSQVKKDYIWTDEVNNGLTQITSTLKSIFNALRLQSDSVSYNCIRSYYDPSTRTARKIKQKTFFEVFDEMIDSKIKRKVISGGTVKNYAVRKANLIEYFSKKHNKRILVSEIRYKHIEQSIEYFQLKGWESRDHVNKHALCIKQVLDFALNQEYIKASTVGKLGLKNDVPKPSKYLSPEQRARIKALNMPALQTVVDISVFLWNTGFSYTDYLSLKENELIDSPDGKCFKKQRGKTEVYSFPPLLKEAEDIIAKYGGIEKLPRPDISDLNKLLKFVGDFTGINSQTFSWNISTSVFRETFASMMENEFMVDHRTIMYMMGHTNPKQLNSYSSIMPQRIMYEIKNSRKHKLNTGCEPTAYREAG